MHREDARRDAAIPVPETNAERIDADDIHPPSEEQDTKKSKYKEELLNIRKSNTRRVPVNPMASEDR
jgi:hypothetical protein